MATGRRCIGMESDPDIYATAAARVAAYRLGKRPSGVAAKVALDRRVMCLFAYIQKQLDMLDCVYTMNTSTTNGSET
jgi:hypothetical protein